MIQPLIHGIRKQILQDMSVLMQLVSVSVAKDTWELDTGLMDSWTVTFTRTSGNMILPITHGYSEPISVKQNGCGQWLSIFPSKDT